MRILTVRQPWAYAITNLGKDVENRSRNIVGDYTGWVAIHAAKLDAEDNWPRPSAYRQIAKATGEPFGTESWAPHYRGQIVGLAWIAGVHHSDDCVKELNPAFHGKFREWCSPWAEDGTFHIEFRPHLSMPLEKPIVYQGGLGLRRLPAAEAALVLARAGKPA